MLDKACGKCFLKDSRRYEFLKEIVMFFGFIRYVLPTPVRLFALILILNPLAVAWGNQVQTRHNELSATIKTQAEQLEEKYGEDITRLAKWSSFDEAFLYAIVLVESEGNPDALNKSGAQGLGQLKPIAKKEAGCQRAEEALENLACMANYLVILRDKEGFRTKRKILLAYAFGPSGAREAIKENPQIIRTHYYVTRVLGRERVVLSMAL